MVSFGWFDSFDLLLLLCLWLYWLPDLFSSNIGAADQSRRVDLRSWPHIHSISKPQWRCTPRKTNMSHGFSWAMLVSGRVWTWKIPSCWRGVLGDLCFLPLLHGFRWKRCANSPPAGFLYRLNRLFPLNHDYPSSVHHLCRLDLFAMSPNTPFKSTWNQKPSNPAKGRLWNDFQIPAVRFMGCWGGMY